jgi:hypothetical protein
MNIVKFFLDEKYGGYSCKNASNIEMCTLGNFLSSEIGCGYPSSFKEWGINDDWGDETNGNLTALEKDGNSILLSDLYSEEESPVALRMTRQQYVKVITDWEEKVCKLKPKEVTITYDNDEFIIETKD